LAALLKQVVATEIELALLDRAAVADLALVGQDRLDVLLKSDGFLALEGDDGDRLHEGLFPARSRGRDERCHHSGQRQSDHHAAPLYPAHFTTLTLIFVSCATGTSGASSASARTTRFCRFPGAASAGACTTSFASFCPGAMRIS